MRSRLGFSGVLSILAVGTSLLLLSGCGGTGQANARSAVTAATVSLAVLPASATIPNGAHQQFTASGAPVVWTASAGTIDSNGLYVAPAEVSTSTTVTVTATSTADSTKSASATVTITPQTITVSLSPQTATVRAGFSANFVASVSNTTNSAVSWTLQTLPGDTVSPGTISGGTYKAPAPVPSQQTFSVIATSVADPSKSATAVVTVLPVFNQAKQQTPVPLGVSGMNASFNGCATGTLGSLVADANGTQYILSNNHVLAREDAGVIGEQILQPGPADTNCDAALTQPIAKLSKFIMLGTVDAALAQVLPNSVDPQGAILGLGGTRADGTYVSAPPAATTAVAAVGMNVAKSGRTTGLTCGSIQALDATVQVRYSASMVKTYTGQIIVNAVSGAGDSGSLFVEAATSKPVALLFAGDSSGSMAVANPIGDVLAAFADANGNVPHFVGGAEAPVPCGSSASAQGATTTQLSAAMKASAIRGLQDERMPDDVLRGAVEIKRRHEQQLLNQDGVLGVGVGAGAQSMTQASVVLFVKQNASRAGLPADVEGVPVRVVETSGFVATLQPVGARHAISVGPRALSARAR